MLLVAALDTRRSVLRDPDDLDNLGATFTVNLRVHAYILATALQIASTLSMFF